MMASMMVRGKSELGGSGSGIDSLEGKSNLTFFVVETLTSGAGSFIRRTA